MGRWLYGKGRRLQGGCWHLRESCLTLGRLCCPQRTKPGLSFPAAGTGQPCPGGSYLPRGWELPSAALAGAPQSVSSLSSFLSQTSPPGAH